MELIQSIPLSIKFILNTYPKVLPVYMVYVQLILKREKATISVKMTATLDEWDLENGFYKANKQFNLVRNNKLREIKENLLNIYFQNKKTAPPVTVTQTLHDSNRAHLMTDQPALPRY